MLQAKTAKRAQPATMVTAHAGISPRTAPCPCGSTQRYKHCCGKVARDLPAGAVVASSMQFTFDDAIVRRASGLLSSGEADKAADLLAHLRPADIRDATIALEAGHLCMEMHLLNAAHALLKRASELGGRHLVADAAYAECCDLIARASVWESAGRSLRSLLERLNARARPQQYCATAPIHIVCKLDTIGGTERRALNLYRQLSATAAVTLWSTEPALPAYGGAVPIRRITAADAPAGGTLVLVGTYFACGGWLETAPFERIVICHNLAEQHASLNARLNQIDKNPAWPRVDLTFPSNLFKQTVALEGRVEYPSVDVDTFDGDAAVRTRAARDPQQRSPAAGLTIGRHGRAHPLKFHPNDPSLFRALMERGHRIKILGGTAIAAAFARDREQSPQLLAVGAMLAEDFLAGLDVFVYRKHPQLFETGGTAILEAMAMGLPVIVFPEQCGVAELIDHGNNGFLVHSQAQAIELIDRLSAEPSLRDRVGRAARNTIVDLMRAQASAIPAWYLRASASDYPCPRLDNSRCAESSQSFSFLR